MKYFIFTVLFSVGAVILPFQTQALTISPVKMELSGDPGQTLEGEIKLTNEQADTKVFYSSAENFESRGESGAPFFLPEKVGLATWIKVESQVILEPKQEKAIPFSITIPSNAEPGGYFVGVLWGTTPPEATKGGQVAVGGRLGVLILLQVSGEVEEGGGLLDFVGKDKQRFFNSLPITLTYRLNNTGGNRVVPSGEIKIKNTFGLTSATLPANKKGGSVLPGGTRKFEVVWEQEQKDTGVELTNEIEEEPGFFGMVGRQWSEFHFGWYTAKMNLVYGGADQSAVAKYHFFVIPWQLLLIIAIVLAIIGFLGRIVLKKYNRWIIAQARQQSFDSPRGRQKKRNE